MPYKVKTFLLLERSLEEETIYETQEEAQADADQSMFMQPGEVVEYVVECDEYGEEV